jgi:hypothetical protein
MATQSVPTFSEFRIRASTVRLLSGVIAGLLFSAPAFNACAIGLPVTSCADDGSADTLRSAVASAQDGDVVTLNQLPLVCSTVSLSTGALEIPVANLTIEGDVNRSITISAAGKSRVLHHTGTGTLVLKYLGVTDGYYIAPLAHGGCIIPLEASRYSPTMRFIIARLSAERAKITTRAMAKAVLSLPKAALPSKTA